MDSTNFIDFIKESDKDKNSNQHAVVEYHGWHLLPDELTTIVWTHNDYEYVGIDLSADKVIISSSSKRNYAFSLMTNWL